MLLTFGASLVNTLCAVPVRMGTCWPTCRRAVGLSSTVTCGEDRTLTLVTAERAASAKAGDLLSTNPEKPLAEGKPDSGGNADDPSWFKMWSILKKNCVPYCS